MIGAIVAKRKARSAFDALNRRDIQAFLRDWSDEATFTYPGTLSVSGIFEGKAAVDDWFHRFMDRFPEISFTVNNVCVRSIFALGGTNVLMAQWDIALTNGDGKEFKNSGVTVITVKKGKVVEVRDYIFDMAQAQEAWA